MSASTETIATIEVESRENMISEKRTASALRNYYELTKPGITQMVAFTTLTGYYLGMEGRFADYVATSANWFHFFATIIGTIAISAGSCVFNHIAERDADAKMKRTASRPIPSGSISVRNAVVFGVLLSLIGVVLLAQVNLLTLGLAVLTWLVYVVVYTPMKTKSTLSLLVGSIPGALPFAGGWTAVRGSMDTAAWVLFAILFLWQIPHFLALSWMYRSDYKVGGFVLDAVSDETGRKVATQTVVSSVLTGFVFLMPFVIGIAGWLYAIGALAQGVWLSTEAVRFSKLRDHASARRVLLTSYAVLMGVLALLFLDKV